MPFHWAKPPAGARPNFSHSHANGLAHAFLFNERAGTMVVDCVSGLKATFNGSPRWSGRLHSGSIAFDGSSDLSLVAGTNVFNRASDNGPFTIIAGVMQTGSQAGFQTIWGNGANGFYINGGQVQFFASTTSVTTLAANTPYIISASSVGPDPVNFGPGELDYCINGRLDTQNNYVAFPQMSGATIGGHGAERFIGEISFIYIYRKYIPTSLMEQIHADPFAMFYQDYQLVVRTAVQGSTAAPPPTVSQGTFIKPTIPGPQSVIGLGGRPSVLILWTDGQAAAGITDGVQFSLGMTDGTRQAVRAVNSRDNVVTSDCSQAESDQRVVWLVSYDESTEASATLVTFDADGFTINWDVNNSVAAVIHYWARLDDGGIYRVDHWVGPSTFGASTQAVDGPGFSPRGLVFLVSAKVNPTTEQITDYGSFPGLGFATTSPVANSTSVVMIRDNQNPSDTYRRQRTDKSLIVSEIGLSGGAPRLQGAVTGPRSSGFDVSYDTSEGDSYRLSYLAVAGPQVKVFSFTQPAGTGAQAVTGIGFKPTSIIIQSVGNTASSSTANGASLMIGTAAAAKQSVAFLADNDNVSPTVNARGHATDRVVKIITASATGSSSTVVAEAALSSFTNDGFNLDWSVSDGTAREFVGIAFGDAAAESAPVANPSGGGTIPTGINPDDGTSICGSEHPLGWWEIEVPSGTKRYAKEAINVGAPKEGICAQLGSIRRAMSDQVDAIRGTTVALTVNDSTRVLRDLERTDSLIGLRACAYVSSEAAVRLYQSTGLAVYAPRRVFDGVVVDSDPLQELQMQLTVQDYLSYLLTRASKSNYVYPRRVFNTADFPNLNNAATNETSPGNPTLIGKAVPVVYGLATNRDVLARSASSAPVLTGTAARGSYFDYYRVMGYADLTPAASVSIPTGVSLVASASGTITSDVPDSKYGVLAQAQDASGRWTDPAAFYTNADFGGSRGTFQAGVATATVPDSTKKLTASCNSVASAVRYRFSLAFYYYGARFIQVMESATPSVEFTKFTGGLGRDATIDMITPGATLAPQRYFRFYRVRAILADGATPYSLTAIFNRELDRPGYLEWLPVTGATSYQVEASTDNLTWGRRWTVTAPTTTFTDYFDDAGVTYLTTQADQYGVVPAYYVGMRTVGGVSRYEFVFSGAAVKQVLSIAAADVTLTRRLFVEPEDPDFLVPGWANYAAVFGSSAPQVYNGNTYDSIFATGPRALAAVQGKIPLALNVAGVEDVGDRSGTMIDQLPRQLVHLFTNFIFDTYTSGPWLPLQTLPDGYTRLQVSEFETLDQIQGAFVIDGWPLEKIIEQGALACHFNWAQNKDGQIFPSVLDPAKAVNRIVTGLSDIEQRTFRSKRRRDLVRNVVEWRCGRRYVAPYTQDTPETGALLPAVNRPDVTEWETDNQRTLGSAASLAKYDEQVKDISFEMLRSSGIAEVVAQAIVDENDQPPTYSIFTEGRCGTDTDLGDVDQVAHYNALQESGRKLRCEVHTLDLDGMRVTKECRDVT